MKLETTILKVGGMTCQGCARSVTRVLQGLEGVASAEVSLDAAQAKVTFDPARIDLARLKAAIEQAGYEAA
jgi:copper chaperone